MRICVLGLGYVGVVTAACLAKEGHTVFGVDIARSKIDLLKSGVSPIVEESIQEIVRDGVQSGRLVATRDTQLAIDQSEMAIVCVGTPSSRDGSLDTNAIKHVTMEIGRALLPGRSSFLVVVRSTLVPSTMRSVVIPTLQNYSSVQLGQGLDVVFHPEFLREGTSVWDFYNPPKIVVGADRIEATEKVFELYPGIDAPRFSCSIEEAEMVKYTDNIFHALKITFANEMGQICQALGIDSRTVMDMFSADEKLNISAKYLRPGFAFGGSCLPKDLRAMMYTTRTLGVEAPVLNNILRSNDYQIERAAQLIVRRQLKTIGFYGLAFKEGTDDLRESPYVELAERLLGKGMHLSIYDKHVQLNRLVGKNKAYIDESLPHLAKLMVDDPHVLEESKAVVLCHALDTNIVGRYVESKVHVFDLTGADLFPESDLYTSIV